MTGEAGCIIADFIEFFYPNTLKYTLNFEYEFSRFRTGTHQAKAAQKGRGLVMRSIAGLGARFRFLPGGFSYAMFRRCVDHYGLALVDDGSPTTDIDRLSCIIVLADYRAMYINRATIERAVRGGKTVGRSLSLREIRHQFWS